MAALFFSSCRRVLSGSKRIEEHSTASGRRASSMCERSGPAGAAGDASGTGRAGEPDQGEAERARAGIGVSFSAFFFAISALFSPLRR
jgi:hypothetical protein